jgi:hypothetical protein
LQALTFELLGECVHNPLHAMQFAEYQLCGHATLLIAVEVVAANYHRCSVYLFSVYLLFTGCA